MFTVFDVLTDVLPYFDRINVFKTLIPVSATKNPRIRTAVTLVLLPISEYGAARSQGNQSEQERSNGNDKRTYMKRLSCFPGLGCCVIPYTRCVTTYPSRLRRSFRYLGYVQI